MAQRDTVLLTGAAGTVGEYVLSELVAQGHPVIATDLPGFQLHLPRPAGAPVELRPGDIRDLGFCVDAVAGAQAVIHVAATIDLALPRDEMWRINVDAVRYLYEAARARGCRRFVFFSSASIYQKGHRLLDESAPIAPRTNYERSKDDAESYLRSRPRKGPEVVILRPAMIYGPRARFLGAKLATLPPLFAMVLGKVPRIVGGPVFSWAHAEDVARAAVFLLDEPRAAWETYNVADETPLSLGEALEAMARAYRLPLADKLVRYPSALLGALGPWIAEHPRGLSLFSTVIEHLWSHLVRRKRLLPAINASLDRESLLYATAEAVLDSTRLRDLGFRFHWKGFRDGYPDVLRWFQQQRWLPSYRADEPARTFRMRLADRLFPPARS
jgi:nucleoside-diphosphate-sugar epimerase